MATQGPGKMTYTVVLVVVIMITALGVLTLWNNYIGLPSLTTEPQAKTPDGQIITPTADSVYLYETGGKLKVTLKLYNAYNDTAVATEKPVMKMYHSLGASFNPGARQLFGSIAANSDNDTGELWRDDEGVIYVVMDFSDNDDWFLDLSRSAEMAYIVETTPTRMDYDADGIDDYLFTLDVKPLSKLQAGESTKEIIIDGYLVQAAVPDFRSDYNVTGVVNTGWDYHSAGAYMLMTEGYGFKFNKIWLDLSSGNGNHTMVDNNSVQIQSLKITDSGGMTWDLRSFDFSKANQEVKFDLSNYVAYETQEFDGELAFRDKNEGTRWGQIELKIKAKFDQLDGWTPILNMQYITPDGTLGTITQMIEFEN
jgi:hypothetical protein